MGGMWGFPELCPKPPMNTHTCKYAQKVFFLLALVVVLACVRETGGGTVLPSVFLGINRGFCLQFGLVTCEHEPGDI